MYSPLNLGRLLSLAAICATALLSSCTKSNSPAQVTPPPNAQKQWVVSTLAGTGTAGSQDGADSSAQFNSPSYLAINAGGDIFVSDVQNHTIRKIAGGQVTTYAGVGISTPNPSWGNINGIAVDAQNNIYDVEYSLLRKITSASASSVFAGSLQVSFKDGQDTAARFDLISRIAMDKSGNLYAPDYDLNSNFFIRKITPGGLVSTLTLSDNTGFNSGSVPGSLYYLASIAVDNNGNIYFTANGNDMVKKADASGNVTIFAGAGNIGFVNGKGQAATFSNILGLACDPSGNIYVADGNNHAIREIAPDGTVSTLAGTGTGGFEDGTGTSAMFLHPSAIVVDSNGVLYIADGGNNRIRKLEYKYQNHINPSEKYADRKL